MHLYPIYVKDKLFFFKGIKQVDGKYRIRIKETEGRNATIPTTYTTLEVVLETIKTMMEE